MNHIRPYIVVPTLIPQPTWDGDYIASHKRIKELIGNLNIGQSYELFSGSFLSSRRSSTHLPSLHLADGNDPTTIPKAIVANDQLISLQDLINIDPKAVLGQKAMDGYSYQMNLVIQITQSKSIKFQLPEPNPTSQRSSNPKACLFLEPGRLTSGANLEKFQNDLTAKTDNQSISSRFKTINISKNQVADFSKVSLNFARNDRNFLPDGNVMFMLEANLFDATAHPVRSDDPITDKECQKHSYSFATDLKKSKIHKRSSTQTIKSHLTTPYYRLDEWIFSSPLSNKFTTTTDCFQHLFVRSGRVEFASHDGTRLEISQGFGVFVPASTGAYSLLPRGTKPVAVLVSSI